MESELEDMSRVTVVVEEEEDQKLLLVPLFLLQLMCARPPIPQSDSER